MRARHVSVLAVGAAVALAGAATPAHAEDAAIPATPTVLVEAASAVDAEAIATTHGLTVKRAFPWIGWYELATPGDTPDAAAALAALGADPRVDDTDVVKGTNDLSFAFQPSDPFWAGSFNPPSGGNPLSSQWHFTKVNFPAAWDKSKGTGALVGIVDSEFDTVHEDLAGKVRSPMNYASGTLGYGSGDVRSLDGTDLHGTHVAGIAAAATDNAKGGSGAGYDANFVPVRIRTSSEPGGGLAPDAGFVADLVQGLGYLGTLKVSVINLSLGGQRDHPAIAAALAQLKAQGIPIVVAAGNNQLTAPNVAIYPAAYASTIAVGNTTANNSINTSSSNGDWVDVSAPGTDIPSTWETRAGGNGYNAISGTSMSSPLVAGLVALMKSARPDLTPDEVESLLTSTATDAGGAGRDPQYGAGIIDASKAVNAAIAYVRPVPPAPPAGLVGPPAPAPAGPAVVPAGDTAAPKVALETIVSLKGPKEITVRFTCSELCTGKVRIKETNKKAKVIASKSYVGAAGKKVVVKLKSSKALKPGAKIAVEIAAADAAGNLATTTIKRSLKR